MSSNPHLVWHLLALEDPDLPSLRHRQVKLRGQINEHDRQAAANKRKMNGFNSRVSELPGVSPTPYPQLSGHVTIIKPSPTKYISSHFSVKYSRHKKMKDLNEIKRIKEQISHIADRKLELERTAAIVETEINEFEHWVDRHLRLNGTGYCPFPFHQARCPKTFNDQLYRSPGVPCNSSLRSQSHPNIIQHLHELDTTECAVCRDQYNKIDQDDVKSRFAKLKLDHFPLRLRRSYSNHAAGVVAEFMENFKDDSTSIFGPHNPHVSDEANIGSEVSIEKDTNIGEQIKIMLEEPSAEKLDLVQDIPEESSSHSSSDSLWHEDPGKL